MHVAFAVTEDGHRQIGRKAERSEIISSLRRKGIRIGVTPPFQHNRFHCLPCCTAAQNFSEYDGYYIQVKIRGDRIGFGTLSSNVNLHLLPVIHH